MKNKIGKCKSAIKCKTVKCETPNEMFFLFCFKEDLMARVLRIKPETLQLWRSLGLPSVKIRGHTEHFYNYFTVDDWTRNHADLIYRKTPEALLCQRRGKYTIVDDGEEFTTLLPDDPDLRRMVEERIAKNE